jgi:hypothetical protein
MKQNREIMKVIVYIPCHSDFELAVNQATRIKHDFELLKIESVFNQIYLEVILSVNSYLPSQVEKEQAEKICDEIIYNGIGYLADINIANAFLVALNKKPDILWIFSANEILEPGAIKIVLQEFMNDKSIDLFVTNALRINKTFTEKQIIDPPIGGFCYGLITGVVYRLDRLFPYLHNGPFLAWTGWSHLAVMQSAMDALGGLKVKTVPLEMIYKEGEREIDTISKYGHSLYGMLILGSIFKSSKRDSRKFVRKFVLKRFYSWHMYSRNWKYPGQLVSKDNYLGWNQGIAESLIWKSSQIMYVFYKVVKVIPFRKIRKLQRALFKKIGN